jgi:hypothetical protein
MPVPEDFRERRRSPRATVAAGHELSVPLQMTVQLLDISANGVLVPAPQPLEVGARVQLHTRLGPEPVQMELEVKRVMPERAAGKAPGRFRTGARLRSVDESGRRAVQKFLKGEAS